MTEERDPDPTIEDVPDPGELTDGEPDDEEGGPDVDSEEVPT